MTTACLPAGRIELDERGLTEAWQQTACYVPAINHWEIYYL